MACTWRTEAAASPSSVRPWRNSSSSSAVTFRAGHVPEGRADPLVDQLPVLAQGGRGATLAGDLLEPLGEQLIDRDALAGGPTAPVALQPLDELGAGFVGSVDLGVVAVPSSPAYPGHRRLNCAYFPVTGSRPVDTRSS